MTYRLSNRQYVLLTMAKENYLNLHELYTFSQVTAGSVVMRGLMNYSPSQKGFGLTATGKACMEAFEETDITRKNTQNPLSKHVEGELNAAKRNKPTFERDRAKRTGRIGSQAGASGIGRKRQHAAA